MTTGTDAPRLEISDPKVMRALAHPARLEIMYHLMSGATATATECAEVCGLSPSATSYHLRALAKVGLVEEAPSRGDGRERVWRSPARGYTTTVVSSDDQELWTAAHDVVTVILDRQDKQVREWLAREPHEPLEWQHASAQGEGGLLVTAAELTDLTKTIQDLLEPYGVRRRRDNPPAGARRVSLVYRSFPTD